MLEAQPLRDPYLDAPEGRKDIISKIVLSHESIHVVRAPWCKACVWMLDVDTFVQMTMICTQMDTKQRCIHTIIYKQTQIVQKVIPPGQ